MKNEVREKIKRYKELKADIVDIDLKIEELEEDIIGISALPQGERTSKTYKLVSSVEIQTEKYLFEKEGLLQLKKEKQRDLQKIDNALSVLNDIEYVIVKNIFIDKYRYSMLEEKLNLSYPRIKQIEINALNRIKKYII